MEEIGGLGIPLRSLWPTLHFRRVKGVSPLLSIGWCSSVSPKRHCCRVSAADKGCIPRFRVTAVAEWHRYRTMACLVTSSSQVPLKTRRVGQRCTLNLSRAETSSRWCGVVVRRGECQLRFRPRHLTMVQNDVVRRQKPSCS
ncbi:uncharacterized protein TNCV_410601 [Trichonephila clavipes]|nr:uncharacterized protein TNCV_410601 [Trichonephila clavipes]